MTRQSQMLAAVIAVVLLCHTSSLFAQENVFPWVTRFSGQTVLGEGVGHASSYGTTTWFLPLAPGADDEMWFGDFRLLMFEDFEIGANVGSGYRWYNVDQNRIYGVNAYWDVRDAEGLVFNQAAIGVESLGEIFDFRANGYTPAVADTRMHLNYQFVGNNLLTREYNALSGVDYEAVANLPDLGDFQSRVAGGGYYFDSNDTDAAAGWRARVEVSFRDRVAASFSVQDDELFGETFNVMIEIRQKVRHSDALSHRSMDHKFRNERGSGDGETILHRLADPVQRQQNIVLHKITDVARDSAGTPLTFVHVVEGAAGDGRFETPYGTISDAMLDPLAPTSVVYTPSGGTFTENVTMVAGTRLLSNGPVQIVTTSAGDVQLPFSGTSPALDALPASIVGDVILADSAELSGFDITGGVSGVGITTVNFNQSAINLAPADALSLMGSTDITIDRIAIDDSTGRGILLDDTSATLSNVSIIDSGDDGIEITTAGTDRTVTISSLSVSDATTEAIDINVAGAGDLTFDLSSSTLESTGNAIDVATTGAGDAFIGVDSTTVTSETDTGINLDGSAGAGTLFITSFDGNTVTDAATGGVILNTVTFDADTATVGNQQVVSTGLSIGAQGSEVTGDGLSLTDASGDWDIGTLSIFNTGGTGLVIDNSGLGTPFIVGSSSGSQIDTATGIAVSLNTATVDMAFDSIISTNSPTFGVGFTTVTGSLASSTTTLSGSTDPSIRYEAIALPDTFTADLGATTINSTISDVEADNIDKIGDVTGLTEIYTPLTINGP